MKLSRSLITGLTIALASNIALADAEVAPPAPSQAHHLLTSCAHPHSVQGHGARSGEHAAALDLVPRCASTDNAVRSGAWSDPHTWQDERLPSLGARVTVPPDVTVEVDGVTADLDW